jgi:hypothetical protein
MKTNIQKKSEELRSKMRIVSDFARTMLLIGAVICLFVCPPCVYSQTNVGTTAAQFLKIETGPRAVAMGGNFVALADDATSLFWNPAGAAVITERKLSFGHTIWFADISHDFFSMVVPWSQGAIGVSVVALNTDEMEQTTPEQPEGTGVLFDFSDLAFGLTFARPLTDRFSVGITGKYISESAFNESASTFAVDLGTLLDVGYKGLRIGMSISNFGGRMKLDGRDLKMAIDTNEDGESETETEVSTRDWSLPLMFRVGTVFDIVGQGSGLWQNPENRITFEIDGVHPNDNEERMGFGAEYAWRETLFFRSGYKINHDVESLALGGGLKIRTDYFGVGIDYAFADLGDLESVQRFSVSIDF